MAAIVMSLDAARNRSFEATLYTDYYGDPLPLAGGHAIMEIRLYGGAAGAPLAADAVVPHTDAGVIGQGVDPADGVLKDIRRLILEPSISQAALAALPGQNQPEAGDPQRFDYEILFQYEDLQREPLWIGDFIVQPGVVA